MKKKLVIIDSSSLLYRAFFALPPTMTSPDGTPTNAIYGFLRMLLGLYRDLDPEYMAVTFDKDRHTFRTDMFADYKAVKEGNVWTTEKSMYQATDKIAQFTNDINLLVTGGDPDQMVFLRKLS